VLYINENVSVIRRIPSFRPAEPDVDDIIDSLGGLGFDTDDIAALTSKQAQVAALTQKVKSVSDKVDSILATQHNGGAANILCMPTTPTNSSSRE